ncbi:MAG: hybrid sensor histidine kinase/response regulator [Deltaproteobacteria bacterium]|nr:hybrid sensor histidine kinase/response regulator [Deltaproteobacteria bacterium]
MDWTIPKIVAGLTASFVLYMVYVVLLVRRREGFLAWWTGAWTAYLLRYPLMLLMINISRLSWASGLYASLAVVGALCLLTGTREFAGKPRLRWPLWVMAVSYVWVFVGDRLQLGLAVTTLPCAWMVAYCYGRSGVELLLRRRPGQWESFVAGPALVAWALLQATFPFAAGETPFWNLAFLLAATFEVWTALGLLLLYFQRNQESLRQAREVAAAREQGMRGTLENLPVMLYACGEDGRLLVWNHECERVSGYSAARMKSLADPAALLFPWWAAQGRDPRSWWSPAEDYRDREWELATAGGERRLISWSNLGAGARVPGWAGWGVGVDVTLLRQGEESLRQLAAGVAHNFNNVLMAVAGALEAAQPLLQGGPRQREEAARLMISAGDSAAAGGEMVRRLLAYVGRQSAAAGELETLAAGDLVRVAVDLVRAGWGRLGAERVEFRLQLEDHLLVRVRRGELMEVFLNLIKNALEAMPRGGRLSVRGRRRGGQVLLTFLDEGPGVAPELARRVFEPFYTTKGPRGQGLGLSSSLGVVRDHGGDITVQSQAHGGAAFTVRLPAAPAEPARPPAGPEAPPALGGLEVLLVEDEAGVALGLEALLSHAGCRVRLAASLGQARLLAAEEPPQALVCDLYLPDGWGASLWGELNPPGSPVTPFLFLTGWGAELVDLPLESTGGWELLHKPLDRHQLLEALSRLTGRRLSLTA